MANMQALSCSGKNEPTRSGSAHKNTPALTEETKPAEEPITYDGVAIPEIHLKRKRKP